MVRRKPLLRLRTESNHTPSAQSRNRTRARLMGIGVVDIVPVEVTLHRSLRGNTCDALVARGTIREQSRSSPTTIPPESESLMARLFPVLFFAATFIVPVSATDVDDVSALLKREILTSRHSRVETEQYADAKVPRVKKFDSAEEWTKYADQIRADVLDKVVFRGEAAKWRKLKTNVQWLKTIEEKDYRIKKLRYEAVPGMWIPALMYEPKKLTGKVPVVMNVNGHDRNGKVANYKQTRCLNQVKRGMIALNVEWVGMGQLRTPGFTHARMNQMNLCGTSGLAPYYLSMKRGIDILLSHPNADPKRVGVAGLSGGGWQTIFISSLDTRVTLSNPVAGYSSFRTRVRHHKDLGDSEQTPTDLGTVADYAHLTAMLAPRPALLTFNGKDNCCFEAGYALPPLMNAAKPVYELFKLPKNLHSHVNVDPGNHNFGKDNRQALYRVMKQHWYPDDKSFDANEIDVEKELKSKDELDVPLPENNKGFHELALELSKNRPQKSVLPTEKARAIQWQNELRKTLSKLVPTREHKVKPMKIGAEKKGEVTATCWKLLLDKDWTVPVVEFTKGKSTGTTIVLHDSGRRAASSEIASLLESGQRVLAVDVWYFGECKMDTHNYLFGLILATIGDRPLGVQAGQLMAVARWASGSDGEPVAIRAVGKRNSLIALVSAALETKAIRSLELSDSMGSLKQVIEDNLTVTQAPELFCFGLLEKTDIPQISTLVAPRKVTFVKPSERVQKELADLGKLYRTLGVDHDPLK